MKCNPLEAPSGRSSSLKKKKKIPEYTCGQNLDVYTAPPGLM